MFCVCYLPVLGIYVTKYCIWEQGLDLPGVMVESEKRGISFEELLAIPEQDNWEYSDGYSTDCVAFVLQMWKEAGLFGPLEKSIQVTEFTVCAILVFAALLQISLFWVGKCYRKHEVNFSQM